MNSVVMICPERIVQLTDFLEGITEKKERPISITKLYRFVESAHTSTKFFSVMISLGKCFKRFLWSRSDLRFLSLAMLVGRCSIKLSQRMRPCKCGKFPTDSGTSLIAFPPIDRTCKL